MYDWIHYISSMRQLLHIQQAGHWSFLSILLDRPFLFPPVWSLRAVLYTAVTREHDSSPASGTCFLNEVWSFVMYFRGHSLTLICLSWTFPLRLWQSYGIQHGLCVAIGDKGTQRHHFVSVQYTCGVCACVFTIYNHHHLFHKRSRALFFHRIWGSWAPKKSSEMYSFSEELKFQQYYFSIIYKLL